MAKNEKFNEEDGVWRTIGGRRVFIRNGQSLSDAMKQSGKFKSAKKEKKPEQPSEEEKAEKINETMDKRTSIINKLDEDTKDLEDYDKYNLAVSKLEQSEGMQPTERQYWVGVKERYEKQEKERTTEQVNKEYEELSKKMQQDDYYYKSEDDRKLKELRAEYDTKVAKGEKDVNESQEKSWRDKLKDKNSRDEIINKELDESTKGKIKDYYKKEDASTNYRNKITDVAKNSKEDNVTLDVETGKPVSFDKGYSVSFQQSTDNYSDEEYAEKVAECRDKCDGKVYAGKYGGDAEASFHTDNIDDAKELMYKYNQESIYDWQHETLIMNDKYDASKNQTNYKEKTTSDYMNEKIRKGASKNKAKDDLPKKTEIKTQGTSNRKEVSENIQAHILDYYDSPEDFIQQMDAMDYLPTKWRAGEELAKGGSYMVYYDEQREFLDGLKINPNGKDFSDDRVFQTYTSLIGRESAKLYERLKKNAYKKYMKQHPGSKMSFSEYKDMKKGGE